MKESFTLQELESVAPLSTIQNYYDLEIKGDEYILTQLDSGKGSLNAMVIEAGLGGLN